jgi:sugar/nucleoside kinase (ribokinase family)
MLLFRRSNREVDHASIGGVGCCVLDILYPNADFSSPVFQRIRSNSAGDGGLKPGGLVFARDIEHFSGMTPEQIADALCGDAAPATNVGGPAAAALVHAAQVLQDEQIPVRFYGAIGNDAAGSRVREILEQTPLETGGVCTVPGATPSTIVLSDSGAANGSGERSFINRIGVAAQFGADSIPQSFYENPVTYFGGTALVPPLHAQIGSPLRTARERGCMTIVATVYDFIAESSNPDGVWPMGDSVDNYTLIDLIVCDAEEARRLTGRDKPGDCVRQLIDWGVGAAVVTNGAEPVQFASSGERMTRCELTALPTSAEVGRRAPNTASATRDTTGCGDNFVGGVLSLIARQIQTDATARVDVRRAVIEGIAAGAAAWFFLGSMRLETSSGEKAAVTAEFRDAYMDQIGER